MSGLSITELCNRAYHAAASKDVTATHSHIDRCKLSFGFKALFFWIHPMKMAGTDREVYEEMMARYREQFRGEGSGEFLVREYEDNGRDVYIEFQGGVLGGKKVGYGNWLLEVEGGDWLILSEEEFSAMNGIGKE